MGDEQQDAARNAARALQQSTNAVTAAYLAMFVLDATIAASALPNVYANDPSASCGARFLVHYAVTALWWSEKPKNVKSGQFTREDRFWNRLRYNHLPFKSF